MNGAAAARDAARCAEQERALAQQFAAEHARRAALAAELSAEQARPFVAAKMHFFRKLAGPSFGWGTRFDEARFAAGCDLRT